MLRAMATPGSAKKWPTGGAGHSGGNGLLVDTLFIAAIVANQYSSKVIT
jgi:hypothetical protein